MHSKSDGALAHEIPVELWEVVKTWGKLPNAVKAGIVAMIHASKG
jgi:hypothetical protein